MTRVTALRAGREIVLKPERVANLVGRKLPQPARARRAIGSFGVPVPNLSAPDEALEDQHVLPHASDPSRTAP
jgi:hypothetical protein